MRLADVFGADNILWVEGTTEEQCFPLILEKVAHRPLMGTAIIGVRHTGDFQGKPKHKQLIFDIYTRLSSGKGLLPPAIAFVFDRETLSEQDCDDLEHQSNGLVSFLPRRMYENYLLHSAAIAALMNTIEGFRETPVAPQEIEEWLDTNGWDTKYLSSSMSRESERGVAWFENVDGAKLLKNLFSKLSEARVVYDNKPEYGQALTLWLIEHDPNTLQDVATFLTGILEKNADMP